MKKNSNRNVQLLSPFLPDDFPTLDRYDLEKPPDKLPISQILLASREYLLELLMALDGVRQSPQYHPESDALYHSLQVFDWAYRETDDPELWLAALFHDIGKAVDSRQHCEIGAEMVAGIMPPRVVWLIRHHLDLMICPQQTKRRLMNTTKLNDLQALRRWDLAGRDPVAVVQAPEAALQSILQAFD